MRPSTLSLFFLAAGAIARPHRPCKKPHGPDSVVAAGSRHGRPGRPGPHRARPEGPQPTVQVPSAPVVSDPNEYPEEDEVYPEDPAPGSETDSGSDEPESEPSEQPTGSQPSAPAPSVPASNPAAPPSSPSLNGLPSTWQPGVKWQIVIDDPIDINKPLEPADVRVWVIDYFHAEQNREIIPFLKAAHPDNVVLCYINAGAIQENEEDYPQFPPEAIGNSYDGFPEWWVDVSNPQVVEFMKNRLTVAASVGCDGVDADNIDGWDPESKTGFGITKADSINYIKALAAHAHSLTTQRGAPLMFGQKNSQQLCPDLADHVDFALLENCQASGDWCGDFQPYVTGSGRSDGRRLPVFDIEYPDSPGDSQSWEQFCGRDPATVGNAGISTILKYSTSQVDGWVQYCDSESQYTTSMVQWK
jgi:hypothetical protein